MYEELRNAMSSLLSVCDGAVEKDGQGYNGMDARFARSLHIQENWTPSQAVAIHKLLRKYTKQLNGFGIVYEDIPVPEAAVKTDEPPKLRYDREHNVFIIHSNYSHRAQIRSIPSSTWNAEQKHWEVSTAGPAIAALKALRQSGFLQAPPEVDALFDVLYNGVEIPPQIPTVSNPQLDFKEGYLVLKSPFNFKETAKSIPNHRWWNETKTWRYIPTAEAIAGWLNVLKEHPEVEMTQTAKDFFAEKAAEEMKQREQKERARKIKLGEIPEIPVPLKTKPFEHQKKGFCIASALDNSAMLCEVGTGKTLIAIATAGKRFLDGQVKRLLVVCPKSVIEVWGNEFRKHADFPVHVTELTKMKKDEKIALINETNGTGALQVIVVNYATSWRIVEDLKNWKPEFVLLDESQNIKNGRSHQSKGAHQLGDIAKYHMILTGTPISQGPMDVWSQYRFLEPKIFGGSFKKFRDRFAIMGGYMHKQITGFKNIETLAAQAHSISFRITKAEALDLPPFIDQNLYAFLEESNTTYQEMEKKMVTQLKSGEKITAPIVLTQLLRLSQITGGFLPVENGTPVQVGHEKLSLLRETLESLPAEKKIVMVARFVPELHAIQKLCKELGKSCDLLYGATENRGELIRKFQETADPQVLALQIATGGVGITLTAADIMIFYSLDFSYVNYEQVKGRVHRISQKNNVTYIHLVTKNTVDETVLEALKSKKDVADLVVDRLKNQQPIFG
jgi:SNF2 family DNA or RNA helicase